MTEIRLKWEPENKTPLQVIEERFIKYIVGKENDILLLCNGTLIFVDKNMDNEFFAKKIMSDAKFLIDFKVNLLREGGFLVTFHDAIAVFVGDEEFESQKQIIQQRSQDLIFPEENFFGGNNKNRERDLLVGLYARGKLYYDVHNFCFYKRLES